MNNHKWHTEVAGNGLLNRRLFLKSGLVFSAFVGTVSAATSSEQTTELTAKSFSPYGTPSPYEQDVIRLSATNPAVPNNGASWSPLHQLEGSITPNGLHYERHHNGIPQIDPKRHRLLIHGMVKKPLFFSIEALLRYPRRSQTCFIECGGNSNAGWHKTASQSAVGYIHGLVSCSEWGGVPLSVILREVGISQKAKWLIAEGADAFAMNISIPLEIAMRDGMLALFQNGERLRPENGYPLRLLLPGYEGVLNVKWLRRIEISDRPVMARNETARYTELLPSGKSRMFSLEMEAKSLITSPFVGTTIPAPGLFQITGLAWSGLGKVKTVEISADGGKSWAEAALDSPVLPKAFTRFRIPWQWNGKPAILKSRVIDETGYRQPERNELIARRGRHGYFHYNAIMTLAIESDGFVNHIYDPAENADYSKININTGWD